MTAQQQQLHKLLIALEQQLKQKNLWQPSPPPVCAFNSSIPFFADSMSFDSWLQWVMLPRFHAMIDANIALPSSSAIAPMAEQMWQQESADRLPLINLLAEVDSCCNGASSEAP